MEKERVVFVKGNILVTTKKFKYKDIVCYGGPGNLDNVEVFEGDLEIDDSFKSTYFTSYYATGEIATYHIGDVLMPSNSPFIVQDFHLEVDKYQRLLVESNTQDDLRPTLNRLIFIGVVCALDVYLCDTFISLVYSDKQKFIEYLNIPKKEPLKREYVAGTIVQEAEIEDRVRTMIVEKTYFQSLSDTAKKLYERTLKIKFPPTDRMQKHIDLRNDLVHRNGKDKNGHQIDVSIDMIQELITDARSFADSIANEVRHFWPVFD
jgi:hypothetical protein